MLRPALQLLLRRADVGVTTYRNLEILRRGKTAAFDLEFLSALPAEAVAQCLRLLPKSPSQLRQDLFVLAMLQFKRQGTFVEFGATNGTLRSNTFLLEKAFGWTGVLAEPAHVWHSALRKNRSCTIDQRCVWRESGAELTFHETEDPELSGLENKQRNDIHRSARKHLRSSYAVETVSLSDLLKDHSAPQAIDYLSIDTEGSELEILSAFDFKKYDFGVITCEHNNTPDRVKIYNLLSANGYRRMLEHVSLFDDWYVNPQLIG